VGEVVAPMRLEFEITHQCNKNCQLCDHRIRGSNYQMSYGDMRYGVDVAELTRPDSVLVTGGEPLIHPEFGRMVEMLHAALPDMPVVVMSNGALLDTVAPELMESLHWEVTEYPGFNDAQVDRYRERENVTIKRARGFWNPYRDPDLDEAKARAVRAKCIRQARVLGRRLYGCCLSEGIERYYRTDAAHVEFDENWRENMGRIPTWRACQHCFRAIDWRLI